MNESGSGGPGVPALAGAFFDVDGTLASSNLVSVYLDFQRWRLSAWGWWRWLIPFLLKLPFYAALDTVSRGRFNERFSHNYSTIPQGELEMWASMAVEGFWRRRLFPQAVERLRHHQEQGHWVVLVGGGLEIVLKPLAAWLKVDELVATQAEVEEGCLTGCLARGPMTGESKATAVYRLASAHSIDLAQSYAYSDSYDDRALLGCVGNPVVVNPTWRLRRLAQRRGWPVHRWHTDGRHGGSRGKWGRREVREQDRS